MDVKYNFDVEFMEEAKDLLDKLNTKARGKILYNIWKSRFSTDKNLFKKLNDDIWNSALCSIKLITGCSHSGIKTTREIFLSLQHMGL